MKQLTPVFAALFFSLLPLSATVRHEGSQRAGKSNSTLSKNAARVPVLVELFTSEGCSSCPPADTLLAQLATEQPIAGAEVIALEEHVDYWNHLGWTDPFSSRYFSARQEAYAKSFDSGSVYTPQMVVDGLNEFVGSNGREARRAIERASQSMKTPVKLAVTSADSSTGKLLVTIGKLSAATSGDKAEVFLAITEAGLHLAVTRGENAGEDLHHSSVVRVLEKIGEADRQGDIAFSAEPALRIERGWKRENLRAVVFIQEQKTRRILGAASVPLA